MKDIRKNYLSTLFSAMIGTDGNKNEMKLFFD